MVSAGYYCRNCKYVWNSRKSVGGSGVCPRCNSREIRFNTLSNIHIPLIMTVMGFSLFIGYLFNPDDAMLQVFGSLGFIFGIMGAIALFFIIVTGKRRNENIKNILRN